MPKNSKFRAHGSSYQPYLPTTAAHQGDAVRSHDKGQSSGSSPLYFFYDTEMTDGDIFIEHIIEMAAKVVNYPGKLRCPTFSSLIYTSRQISPFVQCLHGITSSDLEGEEEFPEVFNKFFSWMVSTTKEASNDHVKYYPTLVAHNGFNSDFTVLFAELKRHDIDVNCFEKHDVHFSDTLEHLQKLRGTRDPLVKDITAFGMEPLHQHFYPDETFSGHRALNDVGIMEAVFIHTSLSTSLQGMTERSSRNQISDWELKEMRRMSRQSRKGRKNKISALSSVLSRLYGDD